MDEKTLGLISGNAAGITPALLALTYQHGLSIESVLEDFKRVAGPLTEALVAEQAALIVKAGLPGTTEVAATQSPGFPALNPQVAQPAIVAPPAAPGANATPNPAPVSNVVPFPQATPAAIPGTAPAGGGDPQITEAVNQFVADIAAGKLEENWEDNRAAKAADPSKRFPDFKHKTWKRPGSKYNVGFYLNDKKMSPEAKAALATVGL